VQQQEQVRDRVAEELSERASSGVLALAAAEQAVLRGQFNLAKVLRAMAHTQRTLALEMARRLTRDLDPAGVLLALNVELERPPSGEAGQRPDASVVQVRQGAHDIVRRAVASLAANSDVSERDVDQSLWGCYGCGYLAEGERPDACPVCGALGAEFEWFGPFYSSTPEHLGRLAPAEIVTVLEATPEHIASLLADSDDRALRCRAQPDEWSPVEIVAHIMEADLLFGRRLRAILATRDVPAVDSPIPPWKLHEGKGYDAMPLDELLARLRAARADSVGLVRGLTVADWMRQGTIRGGRTSILDLGTWLANHDRGHLAQLRRLCAH